MVCPLLKCASGAKTLSRISVLHNLLTTEPHTPVWLLLQGSCAVGQTPRLPLVAEAADSQVRGDGPSGF